LASARVAAALSGLSLSGDQLGATEIRVSAFTEDIYLGGATEERRLGGILVADAHGEERYLGSPRRRDTRRGPRREDTWGAPRRNDTWGGSRRKDTWGTFWWPTPTVSADTTTTV